MTRAEQNIKWCEDHLYLPDGKFVGQKLVMASFMQEDFRAIYDNKVPTRRAIISRPRKQAKTCECAFIVLLHLCGYEAKANSQLYSCAQSRDQAAQIFDYAAKIVRISPTLRDHVKVKDSAKELHCIGTGVRYKALSAETATALGKNPALIIHDEIGQVRGPRWTLYEAMETATGTQENPLTVIISTQAPTDADLLSVLIDDAKAGHDPRTVLRFDAAPMALDPFDEKTIALANPAFDIFMNKDEVMAMADDARRMPAREAEYRNLVLNQRIEASAQFIKPPQWAACNAPVASIEGRDCYAGLDLSETNALTALVLISKIDRVWHAVPTFWLPEEGIRDRAHTDRVPYDVLAEKGFIQLTPGGSVEYEHVAKDIAKIFRKHNVRKAAFDRWHFTQFKPWLIKAGFSEQQLADRWFEFGQGTQSMSPALRELESVILQKELAHGDNPVMNMCAANAVVIGGDGSKEASKDSSNRKLSKKRSTGRIDGMVALAMAFGVAPLATPKIDIRALIG